MVKNKTSQYIFFILLSCTAIFIDRISKILAIKHLASGRRFPVFSDILEFLYSENRGAAFGILQGQKLLFFIIGFLVIIGIFYVLHRLPCTPKYLYLYLCMVLIFSGAIGNLIDRVIYGYVVDFIYFVPIDFPIFNIADIYVSLATFFLIILFLFVYKDEDMEFMKRSRS
ncbi:MAG: signal peptidase II [Johnsonella sp.]|nr:signal peptidase II [Johnsonella sp.]